MRPPRAVLMDIEGTTTPLAYVHNVLFAIARQALPGILARTQDPAIAAALAEIAILAPGKPPLDALLGWMDADAKITPLKTLQGIAWHDAYRAGTLHGVLYDDVAPTLHRWHQAGLRLAIYSSGSIQAQRLLFAHSTAGDLTPLLTALHDTTTGPKRDPSSYAAIAQASTLAPADWLFLSDVEAELDAAVAAGMQSCQLVRPQDGTYPSARHPTAPDFPSVSAHWRND